MTRCPYALWDPLGPQTQSRLHNPDIVCLHTMAGSFVGTNIFFHDNGYGGTESHFGIAGSGVARQWQDLDYRADANLDGNDHIISIETADKGEDFPHWIGSDVPPWTKEQLSKIIEITSWCCDRYGIPRVLVPDSKPGRRGIAYHRQGVDPWRVSGGELWSSARGKVCPGDRRIKQITSIIIPGLQRPVDLDQSLEDDDMTIIRNKTNNHTMALSSGKLVVLTGESNVASARAAGIPVWEVEDDEYDRFVRAFGPVQA